MITSQLHRRECRNMGLELWNAETSFVISPNCFFSSLISLKSFYSLFALHVLCSFSYYSRLLPTRPPQRGERSNHLRGAMLCRMILTVLTIISTPVLVLNRCPNLMSMQAACSTL
ncbi:hypothetical protein PVK06_031624 [Gossypium arboreum]|uniref:Uncharacterized protein n=1 Tax=Gossypium arboreum TaxID=29729 RepID=A0ABR0NRK7_GOSAR|nr:hypothetical protein PVK06_031624 [Gossypium arboreum]